MSLFGDLFTKGYQSAADKASAGYQTGYNQAVPQYNAGIASLTGNYGAGINALAPATSGANTGANAYAAALGIGGNPAEVQKILAATPGYQFTLDQGLQAIDRGAASRGLTTSGNTLAAEQTYGTGLADRTYQSYVQNLLPYLQQQTQTGAANANLYAGLGTGIAGIDTSLGNLGYNTAAASGNAQAAADIARQTAQNQFIGGVTNLGAKLLGTVAGGPIGGAIASSLAPSSGGGQTMYEGNYNTAANPSFRTYG